MTRRALCSAALIALSAAPARAQARYDAPNGRVEVLGLEKWTLKMLQDSVSHYVPGQSLHDAACMATLRYKLGFRDASVIHYMGYDGPESKKQFLSIRVVEPASLAVQWRKLPVDEFQSMLPDYAPLLVPVTDSTGGIWTQRVSYALQFRDSATRDVMLAKAPTEAREDAARALAFLANRRKPSDLARAMRTLDSNTVYGNRIAAAFILSNFEDQDVAWYALVRALRDPHEAVRSAAATALGRMHRRPVDWTPVSADLRMILGGTNLDAMESVMSLLVETKVSPSLAQALLRKNERWVLRLLEAEAPMAPRTTKSFLVAMNGGKDLGTSAAWRSWMATL